MKKKILALTIGSLLSAGIQADITDILITEYVSGTSNNKAIELTNYGADYLFTATNTLKYSSFNNTVENAAGDNVLEGITIAAGETIVIINGGYSVSEDPSIRDLEQTATDNGARVFLSGIFDQVRFNSLNFNGDDHVSLMEDGTTLDTIGVSGFFWGNNKTLRRRFAEGEAIPTQTDHYNFFDWNEEIDTETGVSLNNYSGIGLSELSAYVEHINPAPLKMIPEDNGSFKAMLVRHLNQEVIITTDLDDNEDGDQGLVITRSFDFNFNTFNNDMSAAYKRANISPNQAFIAGSSAAANQEAENKNNTLLIDTLSPVDDGEIAYYPTFHTDAANNLIRINDKITMMQGWIAKIDINDDAAGYKLYVTQEIDSTNFEQSPRPETPELDTSVEEGHFAIKIATQNVLNLFNSPFGGDDNLHGDSRGANTEGEYLHQKAKLVEAIYGLDADIVGLMEIENNGFSDTSTIAEFVEAINAKYFRTRAEDNNRPESSTNKYAFIGFDSNSDTFIDELDSIGSDVITSGIIYRPSKVSLKATKIIPMPQQHAPATVDGNNVVVKDQNGDTLESGDNFQRDTVTATFVINQTGKRLTVAVNHLKSKGSTCHEDWAGVDFSESQFNSAGQYANDEGADDAPDVDFQGQCEHFRVAAAVQLGEELEKIGGDRVVIGDMNSYAKEDPMLVLTENSSNKIITTARDTFIGNKPQFNLSGNPITVSKSYGYISAVEKKEAERGEVSWSFAFNDAIGSLDHILITPSLESRLIDAKDWHINAAESTYYDYTTYRLSASSGLVLSKGENGETNFIVDDAYRSSDHDPAIMSLSYQYGEVSSDQAIHLAIDNNTIAVPYNIPASASVEIGDIAEISLSSNVDISDVLLSNTTITKDGQSFASFEVYGVNAGTYRATMTLVRDGQLLREHTQSINFEAEKTNALTPKIIVPEYDGSGGSLSVFGLLSLLGLGFVRRYKLQK